MADYAAYALRNYKITPKEWCKMEVPECMFICGVIDLELEQMRKKEVN